MRNHNQNDGDMLKPRRAAAHGLVVPLALSSFASTIQGAAECPVFHPAGEYGLGERTFSVSIADLDGDGDLDLAVANHYGAVDVSVLLNADDATFAGHAIYSAGQHSTAIAVGDLDGDRDLDLAVANSYSDDVTVLLNRGGRDLP